MVIKLQSRVVYIFAYLFGGLHVRLNIYVYYDSAAWRRGHLGLLKYPKRPMPVVSSYYGLLFVVNLVVTGR